MTPRVHRVFDRLAPSAPSGDSETRPFYRLTAYRGSADPVPESTGSLCAGRPHRSESFPFRTSRTQNPAWQPPAAQVGLQKWPRPHVKQNAARQLPHQPKRSLKHVPQSEHTAFVVGEVQFTVGVISAPLSGVAIAFISVTAVKTLSPMSARSILLLKTFAVSNWDIDRFSKQPSLWLGPNNSPNTAPSTRTTTAIIGIDWLAITKGNTARSTLPVQSPPAGPT